MQNDEECTGTASKHILAVFGSTAHTYRLVMATHMEDKKQYISQIDPKMRNHHAQAKRMHQTVDPDSIDSSPGHQQAMHVSLSSLAKKMPGSEAGDSTLAK